MALRKPSEITPEGLAQARRGNVEALGRTLDVCRDYLLLIAERELGADLAAKVGASDLVQETFLAARRDLSAFRGQSPAEFRGWLEGILRHLAANTRRGFREVARRKLDRERSLDAPGAFEERDQALANLASSPSRRAMRNEREEALLAALERLPGHYRQVIRWHHQDGEPFETIAGRLGITAAAAQKLWGRALQKLRLT
jgi:RNA polymerase sigma-70 factor (ECF subfamily)